MTEHPRNRIVASWMEKEDFGGRIGLESEGKRKGVTAVVALPPPLLPAADHRHECPRDGPETGCVIPLETDDAAVLESEDRLLRGSRDQM